MRGQAARVGLHQALRHHGGRLLGGAQRHHDVVGQAPERGQGGAAVGVRAAGSLGCGGCWAIGHGRTSSSSSAAVSGGPSRATAEEQDVTVATLLAVCRVHQLLPDAGTVGTTAIDKRPVQGPVGVRPLGLYADVQADRKDHGGRDKAVYAYSEESARAWAAELGYEVTPGLFGENLRTAGLDVDGALIGERWRIGEEVVVEVTMPRTPCATFGRRLGEQRWVRRFSARGLPGAYLRVVTGGELAAGDAVEVVARPAHGVSVAGLFADPAAGAAALLAARDAGDLDLAPVVGEMAEQVLAVQAARGSTATRTR